MSVDFDLERIEDECKGGAAASLQHRKVGLCFQLHLYLTFKGPI